MQSMMTMMTSFYDATTNLMVRCIPGRGEGGVISEMMTLTLMTTIRKTAMRKTTTITTRTTSYFYATTNLCQMHSWQREEG